MATSNFRSMEHFPIYAIDLEDEWSRYELEELQEEVIDKLSRDLNFFEVEFRAGYYCGVQIYIRELYDHSKDWMDWNTRDLRGEFGCYRAAVESKYQAEINRLNRRLEKCAKEYGFKCLAVVARFSSGETLYEERKIG